MSLKALWGLPAPAKLNRFLHLVGRRDDGYHRIESLFVLVDWADTLHLERRDDGRLARHDLGPALPPDDLTLRAARALQRASGSAFGVDISVLKRVPAGAGMGGGSSDAATVLLGLNRLWGLHWPRQRLLPLALALGADVPFFVGGDGAAFVQGIGERRTQAPWTDAVYAVVKPPGALSTADVFERAAALRGARWTEPLDPAAILSGSFGAAGFGAESSAGRGRQDGWRNDLQAAAEQLCPAVAEALRWLDARFGRGCMTGSGSAVFAVLPAPGGSDDASDDASGSAGRNAVFAGGTDGASGAGDDGPRPAALAALPPGWCGRFCRALERHPLADWAA